MPVRAALVAAVASVCAVSAVAGFRASLALLGRSPAAYTVAIAADRRAPRRLRVVGRVVLHQPGFDGLVTPGKGGILHLAELRRLAPDPSLVYPGSFAVRLQPAGDREQAMDRLRRDFPGTMFEPRPHAEVRNLQRVDNLPGLLAGLVGCSVWPR